jgi:hypothetical protein
MTETELPPTPTHNTGTVVIPPPRPVTKWHDAKWKLVAVAVVIGMILGGGMASSGSEEAKAEADRIVADAKDKRRDILGSAGEEKDTLAGDVESLRGERSAIAAQVAKLKKDLGILKRQKATSTFEGSGIYMVGTDIRPGTYRAAASSGCYYAVLRKLDGSIDAIMSNNNVSGPVVIEVPSSAKGVEVSNCATFTRVS